MSENNNTTVTSRTGRRIPKGAMFSSDFFTWLPLTCEEPARKATRVVDYKLYTKTEGHSKENPEGFVNFYADVYFADGEKVTVCYKHDETEPNDLRKMFEYAIAKKSNPQYLTDVDYAMRVVDRKDKQMLKDKLTMIERKKAAEKEERKRIARIEYEKRMRIKEMTEAIKNAFSEMGITGVGVSSDAELSEFAKEFIAKKFGVDIM